MSGQINAGGSGGGGGGVSGGDGGGGGGVGRRVGSGGSGGGGGSGGSEGSVRSVKGVATPPQTVGSGSGGNVPPFSSNATSGGHQSNAPTGTTMTATTITTMSAVEATAAAAMSGSGERGASGGVPSTATGGSTETAAAAVASGGGKGGSATMVTDSSPRESGDDSEDESEILEESPCGRWLKRREEVDQRDVPGIDCVHLAMDTEEGVEVVWNEVQYASLQELKSQEEKMRQVFDNLLQLDHQNIVKFHRYWTDTQNSERPRVIFITEYMSSGSLKQFLKRTKRNSKRLPLEAWRRWCTQILSALTYLHSCTPPVIHGNLTCDSIFIQHNGLVKIGSVVPDAVHYSVRQQQKADMPEPSTLHFMAPEYGAAAQLTAAVDIYAFGMCALEMAALEIQPSGSGSDPCAINDETILRTINSLEHDLQRDLIFKCLRRNPRERPSANDLLFHPLLFEVHSLKLLAAHCLVFGPKNRTLFSETVIDGMMQRYNRPEMVLATISCHVQQTPGPESSGGGNEGIADNIGVEVHEYRLANVSSADKLEKFVEDVKYGVYPLTAFSGKKPPHFRSRAASPERADSVKSAATPEPVDIESRRIVNMMCSVKKLKEDGNDIAMTILLRMDDKMNRQLTCPVNADDSSADLTSELVRLGFVHIDDQLKIQALLEETLRSSFAPGSAAFEYGAQPLTFSATINELNSSGAVMAAPHDGAPTASLKTATVAAAFNQMERNWSVADSNPSVSGSGAFLTTANPHFMRPVMDGPVAGGAVAGGGTILYMRPAQLQPQQQHLEQQHLQMQQLQQQAQLVQPQASDAAIDAVCSGVATSNNNNATTTIAAAAAAAVVAANVNATASSASTAASIN